MGQGPFEASTSEYLGKVEATSVVSTLAACSSSGSGSGGSQAGAISSIVGEKKGLSTTTVARRARGVGRGGASAGGRSRAMGFRGGRGPGGEKVVKATGGASGMRPSIREQMMARKRQLQEEEKQARQEGTVTDGNDAPGSGPLVGAPGRTEEGVQGQERRAPGGAFLIIS